MHAYCHNKKNINLRSLKLIFSNPRYFAPAFLFASLNIVFGTWAIYIPRLTEQLAISEGELGLAVFFLALGTLSMIPFVPKLIHFFKLGHVVAVAIALFLIIFLGPFAAPDYFWLCFSLYGVGLCSGLLDVTMNTLVTHIEKHDQVQFMSASHGFFSLGGMLGAGLGTLVKPWLPTAFLHIGIVVLLLLAINLYLAKNYLHVQVEKKEHGSRFKLKNLRPLLGLAVIGFLVMAAEGAIGDWSALYLERVVLSTAAYFGLGYTAFNAFMALGRFLGDKISADYGSRFILITGCFLASVGFGLVLIAEIWISIIGFGLVGLGLSIVVPELFRYCGNLKDVPAATGISFVSGVGFLGLLTGPVFLGFLAQTFSLKISFMALLSFVFLAGLLSFSLRRN